MPLRSYAPRHWRLFAFLFVLLSLAALGPQRAAAASLTVRNTADSGDGSLRSAIAQANADGGDDTITFAVTGTITLTTVNGPLTITAPMTIQGPGAASLAIDGGNTGSVSSPTGGVQVFSVSGGTSAQPVALSGLTIQNGVGQLGGGLENTGTIMLSDCLLTGNTGTSAGGGIYNNGSMTLTRCTIKDSAAKYPSLGGGLYNNSDGTATLTACVIGGNSGSDAGGCYNEGALTLIACALVDNLAQIGGGGIFNDGPLTVIGCTFAGNNAGSGGALDNLGATPATLTDDIFYDDGGGEISDTVPVTLTNCDIEQAPGTTYSGSGDIDADPLFVRAPTLVTSNFGNNVNVTQSDFGDLQVQPGSPVVGAGTAPVMVNGVTVNTTDITGATRADPPTIGAYEGDVANTMTTISVNGSTGTTAAAAPYNTSVSVTVTVANTSGGPATPAGTVNINFGDGTTADNQPLVNGAVTVTHTYTQPGGRDLVQANYTPSAPNFSRSSGNVSVTVGKAMPALALTSGSPNNASVYGQSVVFTATLTGAYRPGGSVTFTDSLNGGPATTLTSNAPISGSGGSYKATYTASSSAALPAGSNSITAVYNSDSNNAGATSPPITQTVTAAATTTALTANGSGTGTTVTAGGSVSFRVTVADATAGSTGTPGGTVTISYGDGTISGPLTLSRGTVIVAHTYTTASPPGSPDTATATYQPDATGDFSAGSPATVPVTVQPAPPATVTGVSVNWGTAGTYALTAGSSLLPAGRSTDVPWLGITSFTITLSAPEVLSASDVTVTGVSVSSYGPVTVSGSGATYTVTLAHPVNAADVLTLSVGSAGISSFTGTLPVLPGDVSGDGTVNASDLTLDHNAFGTGNTFADINGDGAVNIADYTLVRQFIGTHLP
jgi:hypothetical protein